MSTQVAWLGLQSDSSHKCDDLTTDDLDSNTNDSLGLEPFENTYYLAVSPKITKSICLHFQKKQHMFNTIHSQQLDTQFPRCTLFEPIQQHQIKSQKKTIKNLRCITERQCNVSTTFFSHTCFNKLNLILYIITLFSKCHIILGGERILTCLTRNSKFRTWPWPETYFWHAKQWLGSTSA